jgi:hypothetical protein
MFEKRFYGLVFIIFSTSLVVGSLFGQNISYSEQSKLLDTLRDTSAVLMAVLGVWLAVVCPEILSNLFTDKKFIVDPKFLKRFQTITIPLFIYSIIICFEIFIPWIAIVLKQIDFFVLHFELMRQISFSIISLLCLVQVLSILLVLAPLEIVSITGKRNIKKAESIENK